MAIKKILERAQKQSSIYDHLGWRGICRNCGASLNILGEELRDSYPDPYINMREEEVRCRNKRCRGRVKILYKMAPKRAKHLADIKRRS